MIEKLLEKLGYVKKISIDMLEARLKIKDDAYKTLDYMFNKVCIDLNDRVLELQESEKQYEAMEAELNRQISGLLEKNIMLGQSLDATRLSYAKQQKKLNALKKHLKTMQPKVKKS